MQLVPTSDLTDGKIWRYMLRGNYGRGLQQYAKRVEQVAAKAPKKRGRLTKEQIFADLL